MCVRIRGGEETRGRRREGESESGDDNGFELCRNVRGKVGQRATGMLTDTETKTKLVFRRRKWLTLSQTVPSCPPTRCGRTKKASPFLQRLSRTKIVVCGPLHSGGQCRASPLIVEVWVKAQARSVRTCACPSLSFCLTSTCLPLLQTSHVVMMHGKER